MIGSSEVYTITSKPSFTSVSAAAMVSTHVRVERLRIAEHLELDQRMPVEQLAREAQRAHRVLRVVAAGGVGQDA